MMMKSQGHRAEVEGDTRQTNCSLAGLDMHMRVAITIMS